MTVEFSDIEIQNLHILLDCAVKAVGVQAARAAIPLLDKLPLPAPAQSVLTPPEEAKIE